MLEFVFSLLMGLEQLTQGCGTFIEPQNVFWRLQARAASSRYRLGLAEGGRVDFFQK
jgi:hypothetical protein